MITDEERAKAIVQATCSDSICTFIDERSCGCFQVASAALAAVRAEERDNACAALWRVCDQIGAATGSSIHSAFNAAEAAITAALPFLHPDATPEYVQTSPPLGDRPLTEREKALAECEAIARWYLDGSKDDAVPHIIDAIAALGKGEGK